MQKVRTFSTPLVDLLIQIKFNIVKCEVWALCIDFSALPVGSP